MGKKDCRRVGSLKTGEKQKVFSHSYGHVRAMLTNDSCDLMKED